MLFDYLPFFFTCLIRGLLGLPIAKRPDMGVVGGVCTAGIALACAAFLTAPYLRKSPAKKHREASAGGP